MDDDKFDDPFGEVGLLQNSSSESLTPPPMETIEKLFQSIVDSLVHGESGMCVTLRARPRTIAQLSSSTSQESTLSERARVRKLCFPGKTPEEAWRFTIVVRILELMHEALRTGVVISKRNIYYRDPALFASQAYVDRYVDDIAYTFNVSRSNLNVVAAAKGLVAGAARFCRRDGTIIDASQDREGTLVPSLREILSVDMSGVEWVLVIEKEATFRSIAASAFWDILATQGILLTGKGYPDMATRAMLHYLCTPSLQNGFTSTPVYALVDFDPDGLAILSVYRNGSIALAHEGASLRVPQIHWLGLGLEHLDFGSESLHATQGLLHLTDRDRKKATKMIESCEDFEMRSALQQMLMLGVKAELQSLDANADGTIKLLRTVSC